MSESTNEALNTRKQNITIETPRLFLRPWQEEDAADLYKYASNTKIAHKAGWRPHPDVEYSLTIIRLMLLRATAFAITIKPQGDSGGQAALDKPPVGPVGSISIYTGENAARGRAADEGDIGYWLGAPFHNRGYMTEALGAVMEYAFDRLDAAALWCSHYAGNEASKAVILKAGFEEHHVLANSYNPMLEASFTEIFYRVSKLKYRNMHKKSQKY